MKVLVTTLVIFIIAILSVAPCVGLGNVGIYQAEGAAEIGTDGLVVARIKARNMAIKDAVLQAVRQGVPSADYKAAQKSIETKILHQAGDYVQSFEILSSGKEENFYKMKIEARVGLDKLIADVKALGQTSTKSEPIKAKLLLVVTSRREDAREIWIPLKESIASRLEMLNFAPLPDDVVEQYLASDAYIRFQENRFDETFEFIAKHEARYVLAVDAVVSDQEGSDCPEYAKIKFLESSMGELLAEFSHEFKDGVGCKTAAQMGGKWIFATLSDQLKGKGIFDVAPIVSTRLEIFGLKEYRNTTELTAYLKSLPDMKSVVLHSFGTGGRIVFRITYEGPGENLVESLKRFSPVGYRLEQRVNTNETLLFEALY